MSQIIYKLVMQKGPVPGKEFILDRPQIVIGRDIQNEVVINDAEMSRHHAKLVFQDEVFVVQDMGSTNGVFVNEQRVSGSMPLEDGVSIRMGDNVVLKYVVSMPDFDRTMPSQSRQPASEQAVSKGPVSEEPVPQQQVPDEQPDQFVLPSKKSAAGGDSPAPDKPLQRPRPIQRPRPAPAKARGYAGQVPDSPPSQLLELPFDMRILGIGCGVISVIIAVILIIVLFYIDNNFLWCDWLGWLLPGRCPIG